MTCSLLVGSVTMPVSGRLADLIGRRKVLLGSAVLLVVGSIVCAVSHDIATLLVGRCIQGLAMGFIPVAIATVRDLRPPHRVASGVGAVSATLGLGGGLGLPLSAWVAQTWDWRILFWGSAAAGALVLFAALRTLPPAPASSDRVRLDVIGALGLAIGVATVLVGVTRAPVLGWLAAPTWAMVVLGALTLAGWARYELGQSDPMCDLRVARRRPVLLTNLTAAMVGFSMMMQVVAVPQLLQAPAGAARGLGLDLIETGLYLTPACFVMSICAPLGGRLAHVIGARYVLAASGGLVASGHLVALAWCEKPYQLLLSGCVLYAGVGLAYAALPTLVMASVAPDQAGAGLGLNALVRSFGSTVASAVAASVLAGVVTAAGVPALVAFRVCFALGAAAALLAIASATALPRARAGAVADLGPFARPVLRTGASRSPQEVIP